MGGGVKRLEIEVDTFGYDVGIFALVTLFWATYDQQSNTLLLWTEDFTERRIDLGFAICERESTRPRLAVEPRLGLERVAAS